MQKTIDFAKKFGASILSFVLPVLARAQASPGPAVANGVTVPSAPISNVQSVLNFVCVVFGWMFYFLIALAIVFIVVAAFKYLTSGGNPEKTSSAGKTILYAAIAVAVALLARAIPLIVGDLLGATSSLTTC